MVGLVLMCRDLTDGLLLVGAEHDAVGHARRGGGFDRPHLLHLRVHVGGDTRV